MHGFYTIVSLWLASTLPLAASNSGFGTVETGNGQIAGHRSSEAEDVWEYLGIPYAQPPLGDLRFAAPQKYKGRESYNATNFVSAHHTLLHYMAVWLTSWSRACKLQHILTGPTLIRTATALNKLLSNLNFLALPLKLWIYCTTSLVVLGHCEVRIV
jgi:hypothetical protein